MLIPHYSPERHGHIQVTEGLLDPNALNLATEVEKYNVMFNSKLV